MAALEKELSEIDILLVVETWEHQGNEIPKIKGFTCHSIWNQKEYIGGRGYGGLACYTKDSIKEHITVVKEDSYKQYMWLQLSTGIKDLYIALCYFAPPQSPIYKNQNLSSEDPFLHLSKDIGNFLGKGEIILAGDFNARTQSTQTQNTIAGKDPLWLEIANEEDEEVWTRDSKDKGDTTQMGRHLLTLGNCFNLKIINGCARFPLSTGFTCQTPQGKSVIDYILLQPQVIDKIRDFQIGQRLPESPHSPLIITLKGDFTRQEIKDEQKIQKRVKMDYKKSGIYEQELEQIISTMEWPNTCAEIDQKLTQTIIGTASKIFSKGNGRSKGMPCNGWFDNECKQARLHWTLASQEHKATKEKEYKNLTRRKKRQFLQKRQVETFKKLRSYPRDFWKELHSKGPPTKLEITWERLVTHIRNLYEKKDSKTHIEQSRIKEYQEIFTTKEVSKAIQGLMNGKARDSQGLNAEMIKWGGENLIQKIHECMNRAVAEGFPLPWTKNTLVPIFKGGKKEEAGNYRTIMVSNLMAKVFGKILEKKISGWAETNNARAPSQAGFRPKHSTIDHLITLKAITDNAKGKDKSILCCFVDFKKAFDMVPRDKIWERMENIQVPKELRDATARLYERVIAEISHPIDNLQSTIASEIGVKQGCPLSPTLFGLLIDELEGWIRQKGGGGIQIAGYVILLLIYADDVVLFAKNAAQLQKHLWALSDFCKKSGMCVNIDKTKVMVIGKKDKSETLWLEGKQVEIVRSYKYLGLDFEDTYKWNQCVDKRILGGLKALFSLQNKCKKADIWSWEMRKFLFKSLVQPVILYGCQVWGTNLAKGMWKKIEKVQKRFLIEELGVRVQTPYPMVLAETGMLPLEGEALCSLISYIAKLKKMDSNRIPHKIMMATKRKGWFNEAITWLGKWGISENDLPEKPEGIRDLVQQRVIDTLWKDGKEKMEFYTKNINPMITYNEQKYLKEHISMHKRKEICRFRVSSHNLEVETGRWIDTPRQERICRVCTEGQVEDEHHFIWQCQRYSAIRSAQNMQRIVPPDLMTFLSLPAKQVGDIIIQMTAHKNAFLLERKTLNATEK